MINLSNIPDLINSLTLSDNKELFSKEEKVAMLVDFYNKCENMTPFNLFPRKLTIEKD